MRLLIAIAPCFVLTLVAGCAKPGNYPSLAPRAAEAIDPRVPIVADPSPGTVEPRVTSALAAAVARARGGRGEFDRLAGRAEALAGAAGAKQSESWVVAIQALSALTAQYGVTTSAAADVDAIAAGRIDATRWLVPATQSAVGAAAGEVGAISAAQYAVLRRIGARLGV